MTIAPEQAFGLADRYTTESGEILATGVQALVRVPLDQMRADRRAGRRTAAFISGYQGSPLGGYDRELQSQRDLLDRLDIVHTPGLNEDLAATAVMGSQLVPAQASARHDGVVGYWYGKSPGIDRAGDAFRHGVWAGTSALGGVLALVGDDPACKSSTLPSRSEPTLAALGLPVLYPGSIQDVVDLGLQGIALSRACGLWVAMKIVTPIADGTGLATVDPERIVPVVPELEVDGRPWLPSVSGSLVPPRSNHIEPDVLGHRLDMARLYIAENGLNRVVVDGPKPWLGIVAGGLVAEQVLEALATLGIDVDIAADLGIRLLKLGAIHPLDGPAVRRLAAGVETVLVVEDKAPYLETLVRDALYGGPDHPAVLGKRDAADHPLVPLGGALTATALVEPLRRVLETRIDPARLAPTRRHDPISVTIAGDAVRTPYFCSGCPHNTSTLVPEGALVGAGIGCHGMVALIDAPGRGEIIGITQMGGEGAQWIGMAPFLDTPHLFQNIGDGTFFHSGQLGIQAAVSAGVTMTYKLLYNAAVAMTGGQDAAGVLPVESVAAKLVAEGVREVAITTDDPGKYRGVDLPAATTVHHRDEIIEVQERLRSVEGVTVLIHDQQCAAEKRRDRKRGLLPTPKTRIVIDERVCEGCGDCGIKSNCLSLHPIDTEFGRKTVVDQASCNLDTTCLKGDCPAFVTVVPSQDGGRRSPPDLDHASLPDPTLVVAPEGVTIRMPGIGGTGVVTVSQILAAAARSEGVDAAGEDQTGLSQKAGPVVSTVSLGHPRPGRTDVLLAFDLLVAMNPANLDGLDPDTSVVAASSTITPTGRMVGKVATASLDPSSYLAELDQRGRSELHRYADTTRITTGLLGSAVTANVFLVGVAYQAGMIPLKATSIEHAIELNGTAVEANLAAFRWGRVYSIDPERVTREAGLSGTVAADAKGLEGFAADPELVRLLSIRVPDLVVYQDRRYADRYLATVRRCFAAEQAAGGDGELTRVVAHQLHRVMAYKDEYEVARLLLDGRSRIERQVGGVDRLQWNLHPPMLRALGMDRKLRAGRTLQPALATLRRAKRLRGTRLDPFGRTAMRRAERRLVDDYEGLVRRLADDLTSGSTDPAEAVRVAGLVDVVRGYESVKERNLETYRSLIAEAGY